MTSEGSCDTKDRSNGCYISSALKKE